MLKPQFDHLFEQDMRDRLMYLKQHRTTCNVEKILYDECMMYASDMCIEFQQKSGGLLTRDWICHLVSETNKVIDRYFPGALNESVLDEISTKIGRAIVDPVALQKQVDEYYQS